MKVTPLRRFVFFAGGDLVLSLISLFAAIWLVLGVGPTIIPAWVLPHQVWPAVAARPAWIVPYILVALLIRTSMLLRSGVYRVSWRHVGLPDVVLLASTFAISFSVLGAVNLLWGFPGLGRVQGFALVFVDTLIGFNLIAGFRLSRRLAAQPLRRRHAPAAKRALLIGAGTAGEHVLRGLRDDKRAACSVIGILDDDPLAHGMRIHGVPVLGSLDALDATLEAHKPDMVLIAIPSARSNLIRRIHERALRREIVDVRVFPHVDEVLLGRFDYRHLRKVELKDLLGRESAEIDHGELSSTLGGQRILVTGGAGTIGSEICRQLLRFCPSAVAILDVDETRIHDLHLELEAATGDVDIHPLIADVTNLDDLERAFAAFRPTVVFHAAAYKHVPAMERQPSLAVRVNVGGTLNVCRLAAEHEVPRLVFVSTDKAVTPSSIMGATKRVGEYIVSTFAEATGHAYLSVRFGNVLGSRGSVIPLFERQIRDGGPVTVTHPEMERYFMLTSEAALLVIQAGIDGEAGAVFLLNMGEPVRILDMAEQMIRLSGYEPHTDIPIKFTGIRQGEKLREELLTAEEGSEPTSHPKIFKARTRRPASTLDDVAALVDDANDLDRADLANRLDSLIGTGTSLVIDSDARPVIVPHR